MPNFNDLPKTVRQQIYRLHLTYDEPVDQVTHLAAIHYPGRLDNHGSRSCPPILTLSKKIDKEAAPFYYAANSFVCANSWANLICCSWPRHLKLVRKITTNWESEYATLHFGRLARLKGLVELRIRVDERRLLSRALTPSELRRVDLDNATPQQQLAVYRTPGMAGLLKLCGNFAKIESVEFVKMTQAGRIVEASGPYPGGVLETQVAPRLMSRKPAGAKSRPQLSQFPFLSLCAELRNYIYELHLRIPGAVKLSANPPTSASKNLIVGGVPESVLSLLTVSRQVHDEAVGIFYHRNAFAFHYLLHFHSFVLSTGAQRLACMRDVSIHYSDFVSGGMSLAELTLAQLCRFTGLRRLEIILHGELYNKITFQRWGRSFHKANPARIPGLKGLFDLRGLTSISVRDEVLERRIEMAKEDPEYPNFAALSNEACVLKLAKALRHFNAALVQAQQGNVVQAILDDDLWHTRDPFPSLEKAA
ncbi:hypothetical protein LTR53_002048 [Teratosphaeriaceae sp. CCFEE 6253]|nr:hypothetical protein LTR53_002048 [Teratosphaeriaceae sp. CCFEE 6253]